jgi:putative transposase
MLVTLRATGVRFRVRHEGWFALKAAYVMVDMGLEGKNEVLGIFVGQSAPALFWLSMLAEFKNWETIDILLCSVDNPVGFREAKAVVYPATKVQKCIVHQVTRDQSAAVAGLHAIYIAPSESAGLAALDRSDEEHGARSAPIISRWRELATFLAVSTGASPTDVHNKRDHELTLSASEGNKGKSVVPRDELLLKMLYLINCDVRREWAFRVQNWGMNRAQLVSCFPGRVKIER